jgi:hypothetical protein
MLARMPRPNALVHGAFVATLVLALAACGGARGPTPPPIPVFHAGPTPARSIDPEAKYAYAMTAQFASDPLVMHVVQTTKMTATGDVDSLKMADSTTVDLSDGNVKIHMVEKIAGKTTKLDLVVVGTSVYAREGSGRWMRQPRSAWEQTMSDAIKSLNPIRDPAHLSYVGLETVDGRKLHHLKANRTFEYVMADGQRGTYEKFDVWVQENGSPVVSKGKISLVGAYGIEVKGTIETRFSKFGGKIKITAPKL